MHIHVFFTLRQFFLAAKKTVQRKRQDGEAARSKLTRSIAKDGESHMSEDPKNYDKVAKPPAGLVLVLCPPGSKHYGRYIDELGNFKRWAERPYNEHREFRRSLARCVTKGSQVGAVRAATARKILDCCLAPDSAPWLAALEEMISYFQQTNDSMEEVA